MDQAAQFRSYGASEWAREPWQMKARVIAHFLEHNIRENFSMQRARKQGKKDDKSGVPIGNPSWARDWRQGR